MKISKRILSIIFAISLIIICFFSSIDLLIYADCPKFFINECKKYNCLEIVGITEEDLTEVSVEMFDYLKAKRENLSDIYTTINGEPNVAYFNEKECRHMADCQKLFVGGMNIRRGCIYICIIILAALAFLNRRNLKEIFLDLSKGMVAGTIAFFTALAAVGGMFAINFDKYFTKFHLMFFDNDDWILDATRDRLLMIMPEEFFMDCVRDIVLIFAAMMIILLTASIIYIKHEKKSSINS